MNDQMPDMNSFIEENWSSDPMCGLDTSEFKKINSKVKLFIDLNN